MKTYTYTIVVYIYTYGTAGKGESVVSLSGEVQATRWSFACVRAWEAINADCERIERQYGGRVAVGALDMRVVE